MKQKLINLLKEQPFYLDPDQKVDKELFYSLFEENLAKIIHVDDLSEKKKITAARNIISLCRAAIAGFIIQGDLRSVQDVLDYFSACSIEIIEAAKARLLGIPEDIKDTQKYDISYLPKDQLQLETYNILYLPRSQVEKVEQMLRLITRKEPRKEFLFPELLKIAAQHGFKSNLALDLQHPEIAKDEALWNKRR